MEDHIREVRPQEIIKGKYNFQEEKSAHRNNKVNLKNQNKKSAPDRRPD
jgi:hypothetical protein